MTVTSSTTQITTTDVAVGEHSFRVNITGDPSAETVLWLHGSGPGATGLSNWEKAIVALGDRYHCVAPDIVGFGDSSHPDPPPQGISAFTELRVQTLLGLLDTLGVERANLVGNSMGGMITLRLLATQPERFAKAVLMGSGGAPIPPTPGLMQMIGFYDDPTAEAMADLLTLFVYDPAMFDGQLDSIAAARLPRATRDDVRRSHLATFNFGAGPPLSFKPEMLAGIEHPVLLIHGRDDRIVPKESSEYFFQHLPNAQLHQFGRCGHWTQIEHPEPFQTLVRAFLDGRL